MPLIAKTFYRGLGGPGLTPLALRVQRGMASAAAARVVHEPAQAVNFHGVKHLLTLRDFSTPQILQLIRRSLELKQQIHAERARSDLLLSRDQPLAGKTLGMIFTKRSTRTRVSAETGWAYYGGHPMFLGKEDIQIGGGEPLKDTAIVVSSMVDALLARVGGHEEIEVCVAIFLL